MKATITIDGKTTTEFPNFVRNDYGFTVQFNIQEDDDDYYNLLNKQVVFKTKKISDSATTISSLCTISNYTTGVVTYNIESQDLTTSGVYYTELEVTGTGFAQSIKLGKLFVEEDL